MTIRASLFALLFAVTAQAVGETATGLTGSDAYVRLPVPGQKNAAAFMSLRNQDDEKRVLTSVSCSCAARAELHSHAEQNGMLKMRRESSVTVPGSGVFHFAPGGWHIMLFDWNSALRTGDTVDITLSFASGDTLQVPAVVKSVFDSDEHQHHH